MIYLRRKEESIIFASHFVHLFPITWPTGTTLHFQMGVGGAVLEGETRLVKKGEELSAVGNV